MAIRKMNITETELERILSGSRFTNDSHKEQLRKQLFRTGTKRAGGFFEALSEDELEMAAGGRRNPADDRIRKDADISDDDLKKQMDRYW